MDYGGGTTHNGRGRESGVMGSGAGGVVSNVWVKPLLFWLWKVLPLPRPVRRAYLGLTHPRLLVGVMALIRDDRGRVLLLEHTYRQKHSWGLPGGYLKAREQPPEGLERELKEEIGLQVEVGELLVAGLHNPHELDLLYRARIVAGSPRPTPEVRGWRFVHESDLSGILPNQLAMLRRAGELTSKHQTAYALMHENDPHA
jgi:8-oxo-dGTP diphosphatase